MSPTAIRRPVRGWTIFPVGTVRPSKQSFRLQNGSESPSEITPPAGIEDREHARPNRLPPLGFAERESAMPAMVRNFLCQRLGTGILRLPQKGHFEDHAFRAAPHDRYLEDRQVTADALAAKAILVVGDEYIIATDLRRELTQWALPWLDRRHPWLRPFSLFGRAHVSTVHPGPKPAGRDGLSRGRPSAGTVGALSVHHRIRSIHDPGRLCKDRPVRKTASSRPTAPRLGECHAAGQMMGRYAFAFRSSGRDRTHAEKQSRGAWRPRRLCQDQQGLPRPDCAGLRQHLR